MRESGCGRSRGTWAAAVMMGLALAVMPGTVAIAPVAPALGSTPDGGAWSPKDLDAFSSGLYGAQCEVTVYRFSSDDLLEAFPLLRALEQVSAEGRPQLAQDLGVLSALGPDGAREAMHLEVFGADDGDCGNSCGCLTCAYTPYMPWIPLCYGCFKCCGDKEPRCTCPFWDVWNYRCTCSG